MMITCHECHASISDKAVTCPQCGCPRPAIERTCPECAKPITASAVTCPHCGLPLTAATAPTAPSTVAIGQLRNITRKTVDAILAQMGVLPGEQFLLAGRVSAVTRSGAVADEAVGCELVLTTHRFALANVGILGGVEVPVQVSLDDVHRFDSYPRDTSPMPSLASPSEADVRQYAHLYVRKRGDQNLLHLRVGNDLFDLLAGSQSLFQGNRRPTVAVHQPTGAGVRS